MKDHLVEKLDDKEAARGQFRGPLHGVPITVKESFDLRKGGGFRVTVFKRMGLSVTNTKPEARFG